MASVYETLSKIDCSAKVEKKNGLTYLSWAWAWAIAKEHYPDAQYTVYENERGWNYFTDGRTAWVKTGVTIEGQEHVEYLPVMDARNRSIPADVLTSYDVNKTIQRSLTKALARHGLGLYIYAGEDLPEEVKEERKRKAKAEAAGEKKHITVAMYDAGQLSKVVEWLAARVDHAEGAIEPDAFNYIKNSYDWDREAFDCVCREALNTALS